MAEFDTIPIPWLWLAVPFFLLAAGLAAGLHLAARSRRTGTRWPDSLLQAAASCPWSWHDVAVLLAVTAAAQLPRLWLPDTIALNLLGIHGPLLAALIWMARGKIMPFGERLPGSVALLEALLRWMAVLPILWLVSLTWGLLVQAMGHEPELQPAIRLFIETPGPGAKAAFILFAVGVAPIAEEWLFRGILLPLLTHRIGPGPAVGLSSIAFAALHGDIASFPALALLSVALSIAYARTRSVAVPIAMHMLFNALHLMLLLVFLRAGMA